MTTWHVHADHIAAYAAGALTGPAADSVEVHLLACERCRAAVAAIVAPPAAPWAAIETAIDAPPATPVERLLLRLGCPDHTARLLAATPSLRASWLLSVATALVFAALAARVLPDDRGFALFLVLAPLVPLVGVAAAYGRGGDPLHELAVAAPVPVERLLLLRAAAVLTTSVVMAAIAAAVGSPHVGWVAVAWLLPALALTTATLALGTVTSLRTAAAVVGGGWVLATTLATRAAADVLGVFGALTQVTSLLVVLLAGLVLAGAHHRFDLGGHR